MKSELILYKKYARNITAMLRFCGLWPVSTGIIGHCLVFVAFTSTFTAMFPVLNFCLNSTGDIIVLTKGAGLGIGLCTAALKVGLFLHHRQDILFLHENLTSKYLEDMEDVDKHPQLLTRISLYSKFFWIGTLAVSSVLSLYIIMSVVAWIRFGNYVRIFPMIYPFIAKPTGMSHWILFVYELIAGVYLSTVTTAVDCSFGMFSMQMCGELRVLAVKFRNLKPDKDYKAQIGDCIRRHHMLYASKKKLEGLYGILAIWFAITTAIVLCTLIFQSTTAIKAKSWSFQLGLSLSYVLLKSSQAFSFSYYGNAVTDESQDCVDAIYDSFWPDEYNLSLRKDILIVLTQKPITLEAKGCMLIQLDMFAKIINTSVSYFFLLQTLEEGSR